MWLRRLPEIHGVLCIVVLVYGIWAVPTAPSFDPTELERCSWYGWIGFPGVVCPGNSVGEAVYGAILNLPTRAANGVAFAVLFIAAGPSEWLRLSSELVRLPVAVSLVQAALLTVLIFCGLRGVARWTRRLVTKK